MGAQAQPLFDNLSFKAGEALAVYRRVKHSAGTVVYADAADDHIGVSQASFALDAYATIRPKLSPGTQTITAAGAITQYNPVYAAADGKVASSGSILVGFALEAATADGDQIEILPAATVGGGLGAPTVTVANTGTPDGVGHATIQVVDANGQAVTGRYVLNVWAAATAYAAPADLGDLAASTGTILVEDVTDAMCQVVTDANGTAVLDFNLTVDGALHVMAELNGKVGTGNAAITGN